MSGCAAQCGGHEGAASHRRDGLPWAAAVIAALVAATGLAPGADALAQVGTAIPARPVQPGVQPSIQPDWSALPAQNTPAPASAVAPANPAAPGGLATDALARPASPRLVRPAHALEATGFGASAAAGPPVRVVVATAALEAHGLGSFAPRQHVTAPVALEAYGLGSRTDPTVQRAPMPLR